MLHLPLPLKAPWDQMGHEAPEFGHIVIPKVSSRTTAGDQVPPNSRTTKDNKESSSGSKPSHTEEDAPHNDEYAEICGDDTEVLSDGQAASDGDEGPSHSPMQNTLSSVSHFFGTHEETNVESNHREKTPPAWQEWHQPSSKEETSSKESSSSKEEQLTDEALHDKARQQARRLDTNFDAWQCKKIAKGTSWLDH